MTPWCAGKLDLQYQLDIIDTIEFGGAKIISLSCRNYLDNWECRDSGNREAFRYPKKTLTDQAPADRVINGP